MFSNIHSFDVGGTEYEKVSDFVCCIYYDFILSSGKDTGNCQRRGGAVMTVIIQILRFALEILCGPLLKDTGVILEWRSDSIYQN